MSYNLLHFRYMDRNRDGQMNNFKPADEIAALVDIVKLSNPDILAVQELGDAASALRLQQTLRDAGLHYPHLDHLSGPNPHTSLGILSRLPIVNSIPLTNLFYSIQGRNLVVQRGFQQVDIRLPDDKVIRVVNLHLKSKVFHEAGQTEMRRNEARILATHIRKFQRENPDMPLIVCGDFNDNHNSAAMRELLGRDDTDLQFLPLVDRDGDGWTHFFGRDHIYSRIDYILVNSAMKQRWVESKSGIVRDNRTYKASDHRPIFATFNATN
ncbi:MAG TPA: endonuclease/exonuclease/phosphatase family protein [Kiritimatiellia bacterium]|nr:endonuclease/exonuclease/phosphatase family protein [Kiritimatiellia bacterium]